MPPTNSSSIVVAKEYIKGYYRDDSGLLLQSGMTPDCVNVTERKGVLKRAGGFDLLSTDWLSGIPLYIRQYNTSTGGHELLLVTPIGIYKLISNVFTFATQNASWVPDSYAVISGDQFEDTLIFTDGSNAIQKYAGTSQADLTVPSGIKAGIVKSFAAHLLLMKVTDTGTPIPSRVMWSVVGDPEDFTGSTSGYQDLVDTDDTIQGCELLGDKLLIYKDTSIWQCINVAGPGSFYISPWITDIGLLSSRTLVPIMNQHYFLGRDNVYRIDANGYKPIGDPIKNLLFGPDLNMAPSLRKFCWAMYNHIENEYWLFYPQLNEDGWPTQLLAYSIAKDRWYPRAFGVYPTSTQKMMCSELYNFGSGILWVNLSQTWSGLASTTWLELVEADPGVNLVIGTWGLRVLRYNNKLATVDSIWPEAYWTTPDLVDPEADYTRFTRYRVEARGGGDITLLYSKDEGTSWTSLGTKTIGSEWENYEWTFNFTTRVVRFKIVFGQNEATEVRRQTVWPIPRAN